MAEGKKLAVLFPGIGYNFDRPLMRFSAEMAKQYGYEVMKVGYTGFPKKIIGNAERLRDSFDIAASQTEKILKGVSFGDHERVVFFSKSIGTIVAARYAARYGMKAEQVLYTPFPETFEVPMSGRAIAFHGTADPWMDGAAVEKAAFDAGVPMYIYPDGNHSLETGDALRDIRTLEDVFGKVKNFISSAENSGEDEGEKP